MAKVSPSPRPRMQLTAGQWYVATLLAAGMEQAEAAARATADGYPVSERTIRNYLKDDFFQEAMASAVEEQIAESRVRANHRSLRSREERLAMYEDVAAMARESALRTAGAGKAALLTVMLKAGSVVRDEMVSVKPDTPPVYTDIPAKTLEELEAED